MKKIIALILVILAGLTGANALAAFQDVPQNSEFIDSLERVSGLGILKGTGDGYYKPNNILSREQFAKVIVLAMGFGNEAEQAKGKTKFNDVEGSSWSSGYINLAVKKGLFSGKTNTSFYPREDVTFGQACTVLIKALGEDQRVQGKIWPQNYISAAKELKLTEGLSYMGNEKLPRWAAAVMIDKLWINLLKSDNTGKFIEKFEITPQLYKESIVVADSSTMSSLTDKQVYTDKGILNIRNEAIKLEIGYKYKLITDEEDSIIAECGRSNRVERILVDDTKEKEIKYTIPSSKMTLKLPEKSEYYYKGNKVAYDKLDDVLHKNSSMVLCYNNNNTTLDCAIINDPKEFSKGDYTEAIVLGNSTTNEGLNVNQILTDKGIYNIAADQPKFDLGCKYGIVVEGDSIISTSPILTELVEVTVENSIDNLVMYKENGTAKSMTLPQKSDYYYNGNKISYTDFRGKIDFSSSLIFTKNKNGTGYEYVVIYDPVYSEPQLAKNFSDKLTKYNDIDFTQYPIIIKNGVLKTKSDIKEYDVLYKVTDIRGKNGYVLVVDKRAYGTIKELLPNKLNPTSIILNNDSNVYQVSKYLKLSRIDRTIGSFTVDSYVVLILGYDGKIVEIY